MRQRATPLVDYLRVETVGGGVLVAAAALALLCANTPLSGTYDAVRTAHVPLLQLTVADFVSEGLL